MMNSEYAARTHGYICLKGYEDALRAIADPKTIDSRPERSLPSSDCRPTVYMWHFPGLEENPPERSEK